MATNETQKTQKKTLKTLNTLKTLTVANGLLCAVAGKAGDINIFQSKSPCNFLPRKWLELPEGESSERAVFPLGKTNKKMEHTAAGARFPRVSSFDKQVLESLPATKARRDARNTLFPCA